MKRLLAIVAILSALPAGAEEGQRVQGVGHAWARHPPDTQNPPPSFTEKEDAHDPEKGEHFDRTTSYELTHGAENTSKPRWAQTNYIHWTVNGATLKAEGKIYDGDPKEATKAKSKAWGAEVVEVRVDAGQGSWAWVKATNRIAFNYSFQIMGAFIGEASVQLAGHAYDIKGKRHNLTVSDQASTSTQSRESKTEGLSKEAYAKLKANYIGGARGSQVVAGGEAGTSTTEHSQIEAEVSRRFASGTSDTKSTPQVEITEWDSGQVPYEKTWDVYSDGAATLVARMGEAPAGQNPGPVRVELDEFKVKNALTVLLWVTGGEPPECWPDPPTDPGTPPGPSTAPPDGDGDGDGLPDGAFHVDEPHGLAGETGSIPGRFVIELDRPATEDLRYVVRADPAGRLDLAAGDEILVRAGTRYGSLPFHALHAGIVLVTAAPVDDPTRELTGILEAASTARTATTTVWAGTLDSGSEFALHGNAGTPLTLRAGRIGFADLDIAPTVVDVEVTDPDGVLADPPTQIVVPAGDAEVDVPLQLAAAGRADLRLHHGGETILVTIVSRAQAWSSIPRMRIPVGAEAPLPVDLRYPAARPHQVAAAPLSGVVSCEDAEVRIGESIWFVPVRGTSVGTTSIRLTTAGLPDLEVPVEVVPPEIEAVGGVLRLSDLPAAAEGRIMLSAPDGTGITLTLPPGAEEYLAVSGQGTDVVVLTFSPSPDMPTELVLPLALSGAATELNVVDWLRPAGDEAAHSYTIEVR